MRVAYADPPYPGMAERYGRREVNHERLIKALDARFDGWALSTSSVALRDLLPMCPPKVRVMAWVKPDPAYKPGWWPNYAWEPVIMKRARVPTSRGLTPYDWIKTGTRKEGFFGAKPPEFCGWLFSCLGLEPDDDFHDLFHGSGAVKRAWTQWSAYKRSGGPLFATKPALDEGGSCEP